MSADPQNAIKGQVTDSEGAVIAKARVRYRFLIPFLEVSSSLHSALEVRVRATGKYLLLCLTCRALASTMPAADPRHDRPNDISLSNPGAARRRWDGRGLQSRGLLARPFRRFEVPA